MSLFPDRGSIPDKNEVLARSPFTQAFIRGDTNIAVFEQNKLTTELDYRFGEKWTDMVLAPLYLVARNFNVINRTAARDRIGRAVSSAFFVGYEIGIDAPRLFTVDVIARLSASNVFNPSRIRESEMEDRVTSFVHTAIGVGSYLKIFDNSSVNLDIFRSFIDGLDNLESI